MTVRDLTRSRFWLAALAGGAAAVAAAQLPEPPIAGSLPAAVVPPVPTAAPIVPVVPPPAPVPVIVPAGPPAGVSIPPLVIPRSTQPNVILVSAVTAAREVAPLPKPAAISPPVMVFKEVAKPIPPEPPKPAPPADAPKVTGPASTRPARFEEPPASGPAAAVIDVRPGTPAANPGSTFTAALLDARSAFARVRDYSCHFLRQERVRGKLLPEQTAELYARTLPHSVALKVIAPAGLAGAESVYVAGKHAGNVRVKPAGTYGTQAWQTLSPPDPRLTTDARHSAATIGIGAVIDRLEKIVSVEKQLRNPLAVVAAEYSYAGRPVTRYEVFAERPHALRYAYRVVVYVDKELRLPIRFEAYDQPTAAHPKGELLEAHSFVNLTLNPGVGEAVFDK